jgi:hypothetical protein
MELLEELRSQHLSDSEDSVSWNLEPSGVFSTKSLYLRMIQGASVVHAKDVWMSPCPLKVCILIWQLARNRLPSNGQIKRHHGNSDGNCVPCHRVEDEDHIFFNCPLAQFAWSSIRQLLNVNWNPSSFANLFSSFRGLGGCTNGSCGCYLQHRAARSGPLGTILRLRGSSLNKLLTASSKCLISCRSRGLLQNVIRIWR